MSVRATLLSPFAAATASAPAVAQNTNAEPIFHVAIFRFDRAHLDTAMQAFHALAAATRREPGNLGYDTYRGIDDPQAFYVVERWASRNAPPITNEPRRFSSTASACSGASALCMTPSPDRPSTFQDSE
jgi:quinol monooxygenase YgiN